RHADHTDSVADVRTVGTLMEHIAAADLVVGMRLHSLILAQVCGVPAVGLSYDPKVAAHCSTASEPPAVALEEMTPDTVFGALRHTWDSRSEVRQRLARERPVKAAAAAAGIEVLVRLTDGSLPRPRRLS